MATTYIDLILWDDEDDPQGNVQHIVGPGEVTIEEVEEVLHDHSGRVELSDRSGNPIVFGSTSTGKRIAVVFTFEDDPELIIVRPKTATPSPTMEADVMPSDQNRKPRAELTPEQKARVEAICAKHLTPEVRAEEARLRESFDLEYQETGTLATTGDGTTMGDLVEFRAFIMSLRRERERQGLSLNDVAERAEIDKGALSRLENGQQLNPTINTLARYARALGMCLTCELREDPRSSDTPARQANNSDHAPTAERPRRQARRA